MGVLQAIEHKLEEFVQTNVKFKEACSEAFATVSGGTGRVNLAEAWEAVEILFVHIEKPLNDLGLRARKLSPAQVRSFFEETDMDESQTLDRVEFQEFYAKVVTYAGVKAVQGATQKYGLGIALGTAAIFLSKRLLRSLPIIRLAAKPLLVLVPTLIVGPVLGVAAIRVVDTTDFTALRQRILHPRRKQPGKLKSMLAGLKGDRKRQLLLDSGPRRLLLQSSPARLLGGNGDDEEEQEEPLPLQRRHQMERPVVANATATTRASSSPAAAVAGQQKSSENKTMVEIQEHVVPDESQHTVIVEEHMEPSSTSGGIQGASAGTDGGNGGTSGASRAQPVEGAGVSSDSAGGETGMPASRRDDNIAISASEGAPSNGAGSKSAGSRPRGRSGRKGSRHK